MMQLLQNIWIWHNGKIIAMLFWKWLQNKREKNCLELFRWYQKQRYWKTILQCVFSKKKTSNIYHCFSFWNNYLELFGNANSAANMVIIVYRKLSQMQSCGTRRVVWDGWENEKNVVCTHQYAWGDDLQKARYGVEKIRCNECEIFLR